jgi:spore maturation protein CgeB
MKILVVGETLPWSAEMAHGRIFRELGCEVEHFSSRRVWMPLDPRSWWQLSRPERTAHDALTSMAFVAACRRFRPDVLYMPKAENLHSHAVRRALEDTRARLVVWYPDHPFRAEMTSMNVLRNLKRCHRFYIWGRFLVEPLLAAGCEHVEYLPFGFDPVQHPPDLVVTEEERRKFAADICFVGTWTSERERVISALAGLDLGIWGPYWRERVPCDSPLRPHLRGGGLYGLDMARAFKSAKVVLNLLQPHNGPSHNMRTLEVAGVGGGALLVRRTPEQAGELFREGEHLFCFGGEKDLRATVEGLLRDPRRFAGMSERARRHVEKHHLLRFRLRKILDDLG